MTASNLPDLRDLADEWRELAEKVRALGADGQAMTLERCAGELEARWREMELRTVTAAEAAEISGFTQSALRKMRAEGKLSDCGGGRYYECELPRKPRRRPRKIGAVKDMKIADQAVFSRARARDS
ncbi:MAG: hypothetical protein ACRD3V_04895 [Vicinamibacteria bacterium]